MVKAVEFHIRRQGHLWVLTRDGSEVDRYSHLERATHEATQLARELQETGEPAEVRIEADGREITLDAGPQVSDTASPESGLGGDARHT